MIEKTVYIHYSKGNCASREGGIYEHAVCQYDVCMCVCVCECVFHCVSICICEWVGAHVRAREKSGLVNSEA